MIAVADNRDLAIERQRRGLSQQDIADLLCGYDPFKGPINPETGRGPEAGQGFSFSSVSRFETGSRDSMPPKARNERRLVRADYERVLREYDRRQRKASK